jgi:D-alanine-D-alanine ligase
VLFEAKGLPGTAWRIVKRRAWTSDQNGISKYLESALGYPMFVKPANLGSSVGISKANCHEALAPAIELALQFDHKLIIEAAVPDAREIECAVLGNDEPEASVPGEVLPSREFYDYRAKYIDNASRIEIPAALTPEQTAEVRRLSVTAFEAIEGAGMARVDFLLSRATDRLFVNEINTIPGFTTISMYAKLWEATGVNYPALVNRLIQLAIARHAEKQNLKTSAF